MKHPLLIISFFLLLSCQNSKEKTELSSSEIKNINEIVEAIIIQDSLKVSKKETEIKMLCDSLEKIDIYIPSKRDLEQGFPPPPRWVSINILVNTKINSNEFFSSKDSLYLISQYSRIEKIKIKDEILDKINSTSSEKEMSKRKAGIENRYYEISLPLFSVDHKKAYVQMGYHCGSLCGSGKAIFLKKINGKWKIIETYRTWIS